MVLKFHLGIPSTRSGIDNPKDEVFVEEVEHQTYCIKCTELFKGEFDSENLDTKDERLGDNSNAAQRDNDMSQGLSSCAPLEI